VKIVAAGLLALHGWASAACTNPLRCVDDRCESGGSGGASDGGAGGRTSGGGGAGGAASTVCGDGVVDGNEACDRDQFPPGASCATNVENGQGALLCKADCSLVTSYCSTSCGNGTVELGEVCDGAPVETCDAVFPGATGTLGCNANCLGFETSLCTLPSGTCGDGDVTDAEQCDGRVGPSVTTCTDLVATLSGTLGCHDNCTFDTSGCSRCGNGTLEDGEQCDGTSSDIDFDCTLLGYGSGELTCTPSCTFDIAGCVGQAP
jgi:hypothetical protein